MRNLTIACANLLLLVVPLGAMQKELSSPELVKAVPPVYPLVAIAARVSGSVVVEVQIDHQGKVTSARTVEGPKLLRAAGEHSAKKWLFNLTDKRVTQREAQLVFTFTLMPKDTDFEELLPIFMPPFQIEVKAMPAEITHRVDTKRRR